MKVTLNNNKIVIFINKKLLNEIDFKDEKKLEDYFKIIFLKLDKNYDIDINGYYNIDVYLDDNYGAIFEIENEELDYYNYFNQIDMKLNISKMTSFLYEIKYEFLDKSFLENTICYKSSDRIYLKLNDKIDKNAFYKLLEFSNVIYGKEAEKIIKYGKKVII